MRAVAMYLILVGTPFAGLLAILHVGNRLSAPFCIKGEWRLEASREDASGSPVNDLVTAMQQKRLKISQSGTHLALTLEDFSRTTLSGELEGNRLIVMGEMPLTEVTGDEKGAKSSVLLRATIDPESEPLCMQGSVTVQGQQDAQPVLFKALRQENAQGMKGAL
jgi:hypothetical protein